MEGLRSQSRFIFVPSPERCRFSPPRLADRIASIQRQFDRCRGGLRFGKGDLCATATLRNRIASHETSAGGKERQNNDVSLLSKRFWLVASVERLLGSLYPRRPLPSKAHCPRKRSSLESLHKLAATLRNKAV